MVLPPAILLPVLPTIVELLVFISAPGVTIFADLKDVLPIVPFADLRVVVTPPFLVSAFTVTKPPPVAFAALVVTRSNYSFDYLVMPDLNPDLREYPPLPPSSRLAPWDTIVFDTSVLSTISYYSGPPLPSLSVLAGLTI